MWDSLSWSDISPQLWDVISFNIWRETYISMRGAAKIWDRHHQILVCDTHLIIHVEFHCLPFLPEASVASWSIDIVILEDIRVGIVKAEVSVAPRQARGGGVACQDGALIVCQRQQHKVVLQGWALGCPLFSLSKNYSLPSLLYSSLFLFLFLVYLSFYPSSTFSQFLSPFFLSILL